MLPFLTAAGSVFGGFIAKFGRTAFKITVFIAFIGVMVAITVTVYDIFNSIYGAINSSVGGLASSYTGLLGCILNALGLTEFMTSAFAIIFTAYAFWGVSVSYIITYKLGAKAYTSFFRVL